MVGHRPWQTVTTNSQKVGRKNAKAKDTGATQVAATMCSKRRRGKAHRCTPENQRLKP